MIKQILEDYILFIKNFEILIRKKYEMSKDDRILSAVGQCFQRQGEIEDYVYSFHGAGCRLTKNNVICEYNYYTSDITFTLWDLKQFISTKYKNKNFSDKYLELELYKLIEKQKLSWMTDEGVIWQVYQVKEGKL